MKGQLVRLVGQEQRDLAKRIIDSAPLGAEVNIREAGRTLDQNALFWVLLSDIARAKPQGRRHTPDMWKAIFMKACGHHVMFLEGVDGEPFPYGFRSSRLTKGEMSQLIEMIYAYGAEHGVQWSEPQERKAS